MYERKALYMSKHLYKASSYVEYLLGGIMFNKTKKGRRNKSEWGSMPAVELTRLMANRFARVEVLKMEIKELQKLIERRSRE